MSAAGCNGPKHHDMEGTFSFSPRTAAVPLTRSAPFAPISIPPSSSAVSKTTMPKTTADSSSCLASKNFSPRCPPIAGPSSPRPPCDCSKAASATPDCPSRKCSSPLRKSPTASRTRSHTSPAQSSSASRPPIAWSSKTHPQASPPAKPRAAGCSPCSRLTRNPNSPEPTGTSHSLEQVAAERQTNGNLSCACDIPDNPATQRR